MKIHNSRTMFSVNLYIDNLIWGVMIKEKYIKPKVDSTDVDIGVYGDGYECVPNGHPCDE